MKDCTKKLHAILRSPEELARAFGDFARAWGCNIIAGAEKERGGAVLAADEPCRPVGEVVARVKCLVARRVIEKTEIYWSGK